MRAGPVYRLSVGAGVDRVVAHVLPVTTSQVATDAELEKYAEQAKQNETAEQILQAGQQAGHRST